MQRHAKQKIIVIVGPTASGKSALAVLLARYVGGEVVSADSRQVYRGLDIGTGKITRREMQGIRHHLLDVASPARPFSVAQYVKKAERVIAGIARHKKLPIICGGTGYYIDALLGTVAIPPVPPDAHLRTLLERYSTSNLFEKLRTCDPARAADIEGKNETRNRRRLVRALEIAMSSFSIPPRKSHAPRVSPAYTPLILGIALPDHELCDRIGARLRKRLRRGLIAEVRKLRAGGLSLRRLDALGLEYRFVARHLAGKLTRTELETVLEQKIGQYAKRQKTWFKRNPHIRWFSPTEQSAIKKTVREFLARG